MREPVGSVPDSSNPGFICVSFHTTFCAWAFLRWFPWQLLQETLLGAERSWAYFPAQCHTITVTSLAKPPWRIRACNWIIQKNPFRMRMVPAFLIISCRPLKREEFQKHLCWWVETWPVKDTWGMIDLPRSKSGVELRYLRRLSVRTNNTMDWNNILPDSSNRKGLRTRSP